MSRVRLLGIARDRSCNNVPGAIVAPLVVCQAKNCEFERE